MHILHSFAVLTFGLSGCQTLLQQGQPLQNNSCLYDLLQSCNELYGQGNPAAEATTLQLTAGAAPLRKTMTLLRTTKAMMARKKIRMTDRTMPKSRKITAAVKAVMAGTEIGMRMRTRTQGKANHEDDHQDKEGHGQSGGQG